MRRAVRSHANARGFTLTEVLVSMTVLAFGMLGLARALGVSAQEEMEAYQRLQAMSLTSEMLDRISNNSKSADAYVGDYVVSGPAEDCGALPDPSNIAERDKCEWRNRLRGADTIDASKPIGAPIAAQGCVIATAPNMYVIAVAWQGVVKTVASDSPCAAGAYGQANESTRRVYSVVYQVATLGV